MTKSKNKKSAFKVAFSQVPDLKREDYFAILNKVLMAIDTPISLGVYLRVKYKCEMDVDLSTRHFVDANSYLLAAQAVALISKNPLYTCGISTQDRALEAWYKAEEMCAVTNTRLRNHKERFSFPERVLYYAQRFVMDVLGPVFRYCKPDFGPGSTSTLKGADSNIVTKLESLPSVTPHAWEFISKSILTDLPLYAISSGMVIRDRTSVRLGKKLPITPYDTLCFVPKNWKTDRPISIGPTANMLYQKGAGSYIRRRLRRFGLDLDNVHVDHGHYAELSSNGSLDLSTIDLSSASDTISIELVRRLLPPDWFDHLDMLRCKSTKLPDGSIKRIEKFSAMGNGFTFELESLIFFALCKATAYALNKKPLVVSVFGDDIIVDAPLSSHIIEVLEYCGFSVNKEKTFLTGPFKESCGKDFFYGCPVRPIYFKDPFDGRKKIESFFYILNRIREMAAGVNFGIGCSSIFRTIWENLLKRLPKYFQCLGVDAGDNQILGYTHGTRYMLTRVSQRVKPITGHDGELSCALYGISYDGAAYRGARYRLKRIRCMTPPGRRWLSWI